MKVYRIIEDIFIVKEKNYKNLLPRERESLCSEQIKY